MRTAVSKVSGVTDVSVDLESGIVRFKIDACCTPAQAVVNAVGASGKFRGTVAYALPKLSEERLSSFTKKLSAVEGVQKVTVSRKDELLLITIDPKGKTLLKDIIDASKNAGVALSPPNQSKT